MKVFNEILGKEVDVPEEPSRIISFSPALTETLFMLGLGEMVVGVTAFCARPAEATRKRKVGSYNSVSIDLLRSLKPDLVFTVTGYQREFAVKLSNSFPVYPLELPVSVAGIVDIIVKLGLVVGEVEKARKLGSQLLGKISESKRISKKLRAYVEIDLGGPVSFGAYSYITDALNLLGASNLYESVNSEWLIPELDKIPEKRPDLIIYEAKMYSHFDAEQLKQLITERGWFTTEAVKKNHYFLTPGPLDFLAHHGPSFILDALPWLSDKLGLVANNA
ncbi:MAG: ABC transporter substrate-binding protein [Nitrososphaerota archaeon]|nr:ABC transporter substrate-binding protein [Nitrososphaerota archaeon]